MQKTLITLGAIACALPALAFAAHPAKDSNFAWCPKENQCPMTFNTNEKGTKIINMSLYTKCAPVPPRDGYWPTMKVNDKGKFSKEGSFADVTMQTIEFTIKGKFVRKKKAVGTFDVDSFGRGGDRCNDKEREFVAKRKGPAT
jgi:hypothetical protein